MSKNSILMYWYGDNELKNEILKNIKYIHKKTKFKVFLGPNDNEHNLLLSTSPFYKYNFDKKRYAFCSDYYRIYANINNTYLYMDSTAIINKNIDIFNDFSNIIVRENFYLIWNGLFKIKNKQFFKDILNFYDSHYKLASKLTGPIIFSFFIYKYFGINFKNNDFLVLDARDIDYFSTDAIIKYNGFGSWGENKIIDKNNHELTGAHKYFHKNAIKFKKYEPKFWYLIRYLMKFFLIIITPILKSK